MIYVQHHAEAPRKLKEKFQTFTPLTKEEARSSWSAFTGKDELTTNLRFIQKGLCAYCEIKPDGQIGTHLEHIKPKSVHNDKTFAYENIILSCFSSDNLTKNDPTISCGHHKKSGYDEMLFIAPTEVDCNRYLSCDLFGVLKPAVDLDEREKERAVYTIDLLNLNSLRLKRKREKVIDEGYKIIQDLQKDQEALNNFLEAEFSEVSGFYRFPFISIRKEHFQQFTG